jgi:hypothetical protein
MLVHWFCCFDTLFHLKHKNSQSQQIFGNCDVLDKTKGHIPPNCIFISFVYLTPDDMVVRSKLQNEIYLSFVFKHNFCFI